MTSNLGSHLFREQEEEPAKTRALARRGLSYRIAAGKAGLRPSTIDNWTRGLAPG